MDSPFFRGHRNNNCHPRHHFSPIAKQIPLQRQAKPSPKVVSIPVHFVRSEKNRSDSALKIQKYFRGFLVRKNMKKIAAIKGEVDEMERRISKEETVEMIQRDEKERLRVNEMLMSLLLKLDAVKGVDSGVRDCRKFVVKKVIALQERVEAIVGRDKPLVGVNGGPIDEIVDSTSDVTDQMVENDANGANHNTQVSESITDMIESPSPNITDAHECLLNDGKVSAFNESTIDFRQGNDLKPSNLLNTEPDAVNEPPVTENKEKVRSAAETDTDNEGTIGDRILETQFGSSEDAPTLIDVAEEGNTLVNGKEETEITQPGMDETSVEKQMISVGTREEENERNKELLERMMEDNEKMMGLMEELFKRNEKQTKLLSSLSQRVEQLERAFICDKLKKKKKRRSAASIDCLDKSSDNASRKCGSK